MQQKTLFVTAQGYYEEFVQQHQNGLKFYQELMDEFKSYEAFPIGPYHLRFIREQLFLERQLLGETQQIRLFTLQLIDEEGGDFNHIINHMIIVEQKSLSRNYKGSGKRFFVHNVEEIIDYIRRSIAHLKFHVECRGLTPENGWS